MPTTLSFFSTNRDHPDLHSFPTRRSSDLDDRLLGRIGEHDLRVALRPGRRGAGARLDPRILPEEHLEEGPQLGQPFHPCPVVPARSLTALRDQTAVLQAAEVLGHGRSAPLEMRGDLTRRQLPVTYQTDDFPPVTLSDGPNRSFHSPHLSAA